MQWFSRARAGCPGRYVGFSLESLHLSATPSAKSEPIANISYGFVLERLHGCYGNWVDVEGTYNGTHLRGWAVGACPNQVTTCGGSFIAIPDDRGL
jgi:hypothetical protein